MHREQLESAREESVLALSTPPYRRVFMAPTLVPVVVDREAGEFTIEGRMSDDRPWNRAVVNAQKVGRNIRCFTIGDMPPDAAAEEWVSDAGRQRGRCRIDRYPTPLISPSRDSALEIAGSPVMSGMALARPRSASLQLTTALDAEPPISAG